MAVTNLIATGLGGGQFRLSWTGSATTYYVYRDGVLLGTTDEEEYVVSVGAGESPVFEVLDDGAATPGRAFPGYVVLAWYATPATREYRVQELVSAVWTTRATILDDGSGYFLWSSRFLEDDTSHQFRVIPVGTNGNDGTAITLTVLMVRNPDPPNDVEFDYDAGTGAVTVA